MRRLQCLLVAPALLLATGLAILLARHNYDERLRTQIWTDQTAPTTIISNSAPATTRTVLLLGDSRMAQWGLPPLQNWRVINAGTAGFTTTQVRLAAPALLQQFHPDAVVLEAGINDLKYLGLQPELRPQVVQLALSNITTIANEASRQHCQVILLTTWPAGRVTLARRLVWNQAVPSAVDQLNTQLSQLESAPKRIHIVDLFKECQIESREDFYQDTLHLKPAAYHILTPHLQEELEKTARPGAQLDDHSQ